MKERKKKKLKVRHLNKSYNFTQSIFYKLKSKKKLAEILNCEVADLKLYKSSNNLGYNCFQDNGRDIQHPIDKLNLIHNRIASQLSRIQTPDYIHYAKRECSNLTNAKTHIGCKQLISFDISSYYNNISQLKIKNFFQNQMNCSPDIAFILSKICTYDNHLPTGSQLSVYLCNLVNMEMFDEMYELALSHRLKFSVYADDISISGDKAHMGHYNTFMKIASRFGYTFKNEKTKRFMGGKLPEVTGVSLNQDLNVVNGIYQKNRKQCNFLNRNLHLLPFNLLEKEYESLTGSINYIRSVHNKAPEFMLTTQKQLEQIF